jgi:hypothetical protein
VGVRLTGRRPGRPGQQGRQRGDGERDGALAVDLGVERLVGQHRGGVAGQEHPRAVGLDHLVAVGRRVRERQLEGRRALALAHDAQPGLGRLLGL